jgi:hypothetical protein
MRHTKCDCCTDQRIWAAVEETLKPYGLEMKNCPVCGQSSYLRNFKEMMMRKLNAAIPEIVEDENGNRMYQDRKPWSGLKDSLGVNLDKIDISREMELLEKHRNKKNAEILDKLVIEELKRKLSGDENNN